jgi:hypothetical protein
VNNSRLEERTLRLLIYARLLVNDRIAHMRGEDRDRGSALEWVLIAAATALIIAAVYAAVQAKALEKIGIINDA